MTPVAISTFVTVLAIIGLAVGLIVFLLVVKLLNDVLTPLRKISADVQYAQTAPMLEHGVKGVDQIGRTQQLAQSVPGAAVGYMQSLNLPVDTEPQGEVFPARGSSQGLGGFR